MNMEMNYENSSLGFGGNSLKQKDIDIYVEDDSNVSQDARVTKKKGYVKK